MRSMGGPWTGWLIMRSLETLKMRMTAQMKNARYVSDFLSEHPKVRAVHYLDLIREDDPMYEVYRRQCVAPGSLIAFEVEGGEAGAFRRRGWGWTESGINSMSAFAGGGA